MTARRCAAAFVACLLVHVACAAAEASLALPRPDTAPVEAPARPPAPSAAPIPDASGNELASAAARAPASARAPAPASASAPARASAPPATTGMSDDQRARFAAIRGDPAPVELIRKSHYWISNELSHHVWYEPLRERGGAYLGVGTDQNYLLAGWARSELLLLVDFDGSIADLHRAYGAAFRAAETPAAFLVLWSDAGVAALNAQIVADIPDPAEQARTLKAVRVARSLVSRRLRATARRMQDRGIPTFLDDPAQYNHLRRLWQDRRVFPIRGDLTGDNAMTDAAAALRTADIPLRVLYLSNAEQYFDYVPTFRRNVLALPFDERSLVLRTIGWAGHGFIEGEQYHYAQQPGLNFAAWMRLSRVPKAGYILRRKRPTEVPGVSVLDAEPAPSRTPPEIAEGV